eukprot:scaffold37983_cov52-Cyclotella_meneghiniana.AAC.1
MGKGVIQGCGHLMCTWHYGTQGNHHCSSMSYVCSGYQRDQTTRKQNQNCMDVMKRGDIDTILKRKDMKYI